MRGAFSSQQAFSFAGDILYNLNNTSVSKQLIDHTKHELNDDDQTHCIIWPCEFLRFLEPCAGLQDNIEAASTTHIHQIHG